MKIALIGYGKMGHMIEEIAKKRGHEIVSIIDINNKEEIGSEAFSMADVAIEFTVPGEAWENINKSWQAGVPVVSGTTGWKKSAEEINDAINRYDSALLWSSNFSLGVNIFFEINRQLAKIMSNYPYEVSITEIHHTQKKDAPSGTAITIAEDIISNNDKKEGWTLQGDAKSNEISVTAIREGNVPGTHIVDYKSAQDKIEIKHEAYSREGFALGAVIAAEFLAGKKGLFTMRDILKF